MPRKKTTDPDPAVTAQNSTTETPTEEQPSPKKRRSTKATEATPVEEAKAEQEPVSVLEKLKSTIKRVRQRARTKVEPEAAAKPEEPAEASLAEPETTTPEEVVEGAESKAKGRTRRPRASKAEKEPEPKRADAEPVVGPDIETLAAGLEEMLGPGEFFPTLSWRNKSRAPRTDDEARETSGLAPRKSSKRRRKDVPEGPITAAAALVPPEPVKKKTDRRTSRKTASEPVAVVEPPKKPEPLIPPKPLIPTPIDAPQLIKRDGNPILVYQGRAIPPLFFFGSPSDEKKAQTVFEEIRLAGEAGLHIHSLLIEFEPETESVQHSARLAAYLLNKAIEADPDALLVYRLVIQAPVGWQSKYPKAKYTFLNGKTAEPSICDDAYWSDAAVCIGNFVRQIRSVPKSDRVIGIHLEHGEWFNPEDAGYDTSPAATELFRQWARKRYLGEVVTLRAAWFDGQAEFDKLEIPEYQHAATLGEKFVRSSRKERKWVDYHLFLSDATAARISDLAYAVKEASDGRFLVGVSYGYTFEWSHPDSGHLSLGKLLRTPEIDFIAGPPSYKGREPGATAAFPCPIDSVSLNGKLYISEEDFKTAIGEGYDPDDFNPVVKTPQALEAVHWRGAGAALAHAHGVSWMDLWGNGWLKTPSVWSRGQVLKKLLSMGIAAPVSPPDVAVFIDERALGYLVDAQAFKILVQNVREAILRSGLSAGFYLLSDLTHRETFPESKLYVFVNAWDIRQELRSAIKQRLQRDGKVLFWLYAAGLFESGRESLERAREVTGIALKAQPYSSRTGTTILHRRHPLCEAFSESERIGGIKVEPSYFGIPEEATVLGEYTQTGLPSFVVREFGKPSQPDTHWKTVFLGEPVVTSGLIRALGQMAGAHVWSFQDDVVHVRAPFLLVHCTGTGQRTIALPGKWSAYNLLSQEWAAVDSTHIRFMAIDGTSHLFLVGPKPELEHLLSSDPDELLKIDEITPVDENTVRFDAINFDIPIMKLDEWIEGANEEDSGEEWLFRPKLFEEPEVVIEEAEGRRRRRRTKSPDMEGRRKKDETPSEVVDVATDEELGLNVLFRKRD